MKHLTGEYRFRNEGDLLVLQVEETEYKNSPYMVGETKETWRDARTEDLLEIAFDKSQRRINSKISATNNEMLP